MVAATKWPDRRAREIVALCADVDASVGIIVRANYGDDDDDGLGQGYYVGLRIWGDKLTIEVRKRERRNSPRAARAPL